MVHRQGTSQGTLCTDLSMHRTSLCTVCTCWESRNIRKEVHSAETSSPAKHAALDPAQAEGCIRQAAGCNATQHVFM